MRRLPGVCWECGHREVLRQDQPKFKGDEQQVYCEWCAATCTYEDYARDTGLNRLLEGRRP